MSGFASVARNYQSGLKDKPFYRSQRGGISELEQYSIDATRRYMANAPRIRDSRFARSRAYDMDTAIKENREKVISDTVYNTTDPRQLAGLHGRVQASLTRTGESLANFKPSLTTKSLPDSLSSSSLARRDAFEIADRARLSAIDSLSKAHDANATAMFGGNMYGAVAQSLAFKKPRSATGASLPNIRVASATDRLSNRGVVQGHYAPPIIDFANMDKNAQRKFRAGISQLRQKGIRKGTLEYNKHMRRLLREIKRNRGLRKQLGIPADTLATSPGTTRSGARRRGGRRNEKTKQSVRTPLKTRTATPARPAPKRSRTEELQQTNYMYSPMGAGFTE